MTSTPKKRSSAAQRKRSQSSRIKKAPARGDEKTQTKRNDGADGSATRPANGGNRVTVRVYRQGLGDCILVRVKRAGKEDFKLLIDCGLVLGAKPNPPDVMTQVAKDIVADTGGSVDAVAITHEHWDHLSGFSQANTSFADLEVGEVWVAWTEDETDDLANQLRTDLGRAKTALALCATALNATGDAETLEMLEDVAAMPFGARAGTNSTAATFKSVKAGSVFKGQKTLRPLRICRPADGPIEIGTNNARIYVLGPPHDAKLIRKINPSTRSPETYGLALNGDGALSQGVIAALTQFEQELSEEDKHRLGIDAANGLATGHWNEHPEGVAPFHQRMTIPLSGQEALKSFGASDENGYVEKFFTENYFEADAWRRIDGDWLGSAPELAMAIQSYTNNTSLVLALEIGPPGSGDVFLFAADAQVGNWESWQAWTWPADKPDVTGPDLLARTIFYKIGHHGSHNATLKAHGLEQMKRLKVAVCPVDEAEAKAKHWDRMPFPDLMDAMSAMKPEVVVLRTDQPPKSAPDFVKVDSLFFEIAF